MAAVPAAPAEPNKKPVEPAKADHTTGMVKEKIEPGRDIFANPIQDVKVNVDTTNGVDPAELEEKKKSKEEKMRSEIEALKNKVGPLSPSDVIAKAAIEKAESDAIVKDPSKDDSKPEEEKKAETTAPKEVGKTEQTVEKVEEKKTEENVAEPKPKGEDAHSSEEKEEPVLSIQTAPTSAHEGEAKERKKKPLSPEEIEAERVRQSLYETDKE
jgi:hypothetical protein